jgi:hypothetical protein
MKLYSYRSGKIGGEVGNGEPSKGTRRDDGNFT